jgi:hypothetical protein
MGSAANGGLAQLVATHGITCFVEGGTGWGQGVRDALAIPALAQIHSVEIDLQTFQRNQRWFKHEPRVTLYHGDTRDVFPMLSSRTFRREAVVWFLDAHFPGSGKAVPEPMLPLPAVPPRDIIPLVDEVIAITEGRDVSRDVFIIDDRCLWEAGDYEGGDEVLLRDALHSDDLVTVERMLHAHLATRYWNDKGYLILTPR